MRETKFRGKCINNGEYGYQKDGDWVYGFPNFEVVESGGDYVGVYYINDWERGYTFEVDVNTIGQYTGLKDKKDKKIFEGDILKGIFYGFPFPVNDYKFRVFWDNEEAGFKANYFNANECKIIGNIYDNKELLEEK